MADIYAGDVSLLVNGNTSLTDSSAFNHAFTVVSSAASSAAQSKFGGGSVSFPNYPSNFSVTHASAFDFGSGDFTVESWVRTPTVTVIASCIDTTNNFPQWSVTIKQVNADFVVGFDCDKLFLRGATHLSPNTWYHVAVSRNGGTVRIYLNGALEASSAVTGVLWTTTPTGPYRVYSGNPSLGDDAGNSSAGSYLDDYRITKAVGRYSSAFTAPTSEFTLYDPAASATFNGTAPSPIILATGGGSAVMEPPKPSVFASGYDATGERAAFLVAPYPTLSAYSGSAATLTAPRQTLAVNGTFTVVGTAALAAPTPILSATGTVAATASAAIKAPMATMVGYFGAVASVSIAGKATLAATGSSGSIGYATLTAPLFDLTASATRQNSGAAILTAPVGRLATTGAAWLIAPGATLTAIGSATVAVTYEAYAMNLNHRDPASNDQVTRYTNYPFDRIVRYKNSYFGMNSTGLYLLEGTTDNATPIAYDVKTHVTDFDATEQKTVVSAYMGGRMGSAETVTLFAGEKTANAYPYTTPRGATPQNYRQKFGRGIKARYYGIGFKGDKEFDLDTLELEINKLPRRI